MPVYKKKWKSNKRLHHAIWAESDHTVGLFDKTVNVIYTDMNDIDNVWYQTNAELARLKLVLVSTVQYML